MNHHHRLVATICGLAALGAGGLLTGCASDQPSTTSDEGRELRQSVVDHRVDGVADQLRWRGAHTDVGATGLVGDIRDASHLNGLLAHFTSMNVEVVELRRIDVTNSGPSDPSSHQQLNPEKEITS